MWDHISFLLTSLLTTSLWWSIRHRPFLRRALRSCRMQRIPQPDQSYIGRRRGVSVGLESDLTDRMQMCDWSPFHARITSNYADLRLLTLRVILRLR